MKSFFIPSEHKKLNKCPFRFPLQLSTRSVALIMLGVTFFASFVNKPLESHRENVKLKEKPANLRLQLEFEKGMQLKREPCINYVFRVLMQINAHDI